MALNGSLATKDAAGKLVTDLSLAIVGWNGGTPMSANGLGIGTSGIGPYYNAGLAYYGERLAVSAGPVTNWIAGLPVDALGRVVVANAAVTNYAPNGIPLTATGVVAVTTAASGDTEAPTTPTSLVATPVSDTQINLTWTPAIDNVGVVGYVVERCTGAACVNFAQIATSATNAYNDPTVVGATAYRYRVAGYDAAANVSAYSNVADAVTSATPPIAQSAADVVTAADLLAQLVERVSADVVAFAETFQTASAKALAEALVSTDALVWVLSQALADAVSANDAVAFMLAKSYDEAVVTADANSMGVGRVSSDFASTVDSVGFSGSGATGLSDTTAASDALSWLMDTFRGDAPTVTDVAALMASKEFFDNIGLADALTQLLTKALADAVASAETMDQLMDRITSDVTTSTDALARNLSKTLTDGVTSTDNITPSQALTAALTDSVTSTDNATPTHTPGSGFDPATLFAAGEQGGWWDPSDLSTIFQDAAGTTPVTASGQPLGRINDKSGRGNHRTQSTAGSRPLWKQEGGRSYIEYNGVDQWLVTGTVNFGTGAFNKIAVWAGIHREVDPPTSGCFVELSVTSASNNGVFMVQVPGAATFQYFWRSRGTADPQMNVSGQGLAPQRIVWSSTGDLPNDIMRARINGVEVGFSSGNQGTGDYGNYPIYTGRRAGTSQPFKGRDYGLIVRGTTAAQGITTAQQVADTEQWLAPKTGLTF